MAENKENKQNDNVKEYGQTILNNGKNGKIHVMTIIGEIEGHENLPAASKTTKYEHILPQLASIENDDEIIAEFINFVISMSDCGLK